MAMEVQRALMLALLLLAQAAEARWKPDYAAAPQAVQDWYANAQVPAPAIPRLGFIPCCSFSEVVRTQFRVDKTTGGDEWYYRDAGGVFRRIPPDIIHWGERAPDGQAILFVLDHDVMGNPKGTPTCFWPPDGGL